MSAGVVALLALATGCASPPAPSVTAPSVPTEDAATHAATAPVASDAQREDSTANADAGTPCNPDFEDCSGAAPTSPAAPPPLAGSVPSDVLSGRVEASGHLSPAAIRKVVEASFSALRTCRARASGAGHVIVKFAIDRSGAVAWSAVGYSDLPEPLATCVAQTFGRLTFPLPEGGVVEVVYPVTFGAN